MNIAKLIAKFKKDGYASLSDEERKLLTANKSLLSPAQLKQFEKDEAAAKDDDEDEDDDKPEDSKDDDKGDDEDEDEDKEDEDDEDEDGAKSISRGQLKKLIGSAVKSEVSASTAKMADQIVAKFLKGAKLQRAKALDTGDRSEDPSRETTKEWLKALLSKDHTKLMAMPHQKAATFNSDLSDARGGYLVPDELRAEVLRIAETQYGLARREFRYLPFSGAGNERKIPTLASSISTFWVNEGAAKSSSNPTFGLVTQTLKKLATIIPFTEEILEDSAVNLTQLVAELFAEAISKEEDEQFFNGTGSPWTGILNNASVNKVELGAGQGFADITADDLLDLIDATPTGALAGAKFYLNRQALSVIRKLKSSTAGEYIFQRPGNGLPGTIWDYPYELSDAFPDNTTTGVNKPLIAFGNLKLAAILGDKQQIRVKLLDQATVTDGDGETTLNLAEQDMVALRLEERVGYVLALPTAVSVLLTGDAS